MRQQCGSIAHQPAGLGKIAQRIAAGEWNAASAVAGGLLLRHEPQPGSRRSSNAQCEQFNGSNPKFQHCDAANSKFFFRLGNVA
jgi:hypothetical protein